ncbi:hypothetical protein V3471_14715 [Flavobacterium oreochromis]|uniref:hypothetical protein n=1 Tax=Flavobacterium oreochromis TaxID=2906078 RepID=UPI0038584C3C
MENFLEENNQKNEEKKEIDITKEIKKISLKHYLIIESLKNNNIEDAIKKLSELDKNMLKTFNIKFSDKLKKEALEIINFL